MSFRSKQRCVFVLLVVLVAWPPVHHLLVRTHQLWPWKFYGFSMYCTETGSHTLVVLRSAEGARILDVDGLEPGDPRALAYRSFRARRNTFGAFAEPDALARALFALEPDVDAVDVFVQHYQLDPGSSLLVGSARYRYPYARTDRE